MATARVTKFKADKRTAFCGIIRSASLLGLLCSMLYCIFTYHEQFTIANLKQLVSNFSSAPASGEFAGYSFETGTDSVYDDFGSGLAVLSSDTLSFVSSRGREEISAQLKYSAPAMSVCRDNMIAFDRGGKGICVTNRVAALWQKELESDVLSADINSSGAYCIVTDEQGYRAAVTLFDNNHNEKFKWMTSEFYIARAAVSPDTHRIATLCMREKDGARNSSIRIFSTGNEEPLHNIDIGGITVYSMEYYANGSLMLVTDSGVLVYGNDGELECKFEYAKGSLITFCHRAEELPCVAIETGDSVTRSRVVIVSEDAEAVVDTKFTQAVRSVSNNASMAAVLLADSAAVIDAKDDGEAKTVENVNARDIIMRSDGSVMLIYADRAELMQN